MKLWKVKLLNYFGELQDVVYYNSRAAAEDHAANHEHGAYVSYAGNYSEARACRFLTLDEETALSPADFYEYIYSEIKYLESYAEYPAYRAGLRAGFV